MLPPDFFKKKEYQRTEWRVACLFVDIPIGFNEMYRVSDYLYASAKKRIF